MEPSNEEGMLWCIQGISLPSEDGYTYLNDYARTQIKNAAMKMRDMREEIDRLRKELNNLKGKM